MTPDRVCEMGDEICRFFFSTPSEKHCKRPARSASPEIYAENREIFADLADDADLFHAFSESGERKNGAIGGGAACCRAGIWADSVVLIPRVHPFSVLFSLFGGKEPMISGLNLWRGERRLQLPPKV